MHYTALLNTPLIRLCDFGETFVKIVLSTSKLYILISTLSTLDAIANCGTGIPVFGPDLQISCRIEETHKGQDLSRIWWMVSSDFLASGEGSVEILIAHGNTPPHSAGLLSYCSIIY